MSLPDGRGHWYDGGSRHRRNDSLRRGDTRGVCPSVFSLAPITPEGLRLAQGPIAFRWVGPRVTPFPCSHPTTRHRHEWVHFYLFFLFRYRRARRRQGSKSPNRNPNLWTVTNRSIVLGCLVSFRVFRPPRVLARLIRHGVYPLSHSPLFYPFGSLSPCKFSRRGYEGVGVSLSVSPIPFSLPSVLFYVRSSPFGRSTSPLLRCLSRPSPGQSPLGARHSPLLPPSLSLSSIS